MAFFPDVLELIEFRSREKMKTPPSHPTTSQSSKFERAFVLLHGLGARYRSEQSVHESIFMRFLAKCVNSTAMREAT